MGPKVPQYSDTKPVGFRIGPCFLRFVLALLARPWARNQNGRSKLRSATCSLQSLATVPLIFAVSKPFRRQPSRPRCHRPFCARARKSLLAVWSPALSATATSSWWLLAMQRGRNLTLQLFNQWELNSCAFWRWWLSLSHLGTCRCACEQLSSLKPAVRKGTVA